MSADETAKLRLAIPRLVQELTLASRRREDEPHALNFMPVADAYAEHEISGGKLRELLMLWVRGATREELVALLPKEGEP